MSVAPLNVRCFTFKGGSHLPALLLHLISEGAKRLTVCFSLSDVDTLNHCAHFLRLLNNSGLTNPYRKSIRLVIKSSKLSLLVLPHQTKTKDETLLRPSALPYAEKKNPRRWKTSGMRTGFRQYKSLFALPHTKRFCATNIYRKKQ